MLSFVHLDEYIGQKEKGSQVLSKKQKRISEWR
jgi:hypothetical protein